jgi:hypothetical protein
VEGRPRVRGRVSGACGDKRIIESAETISNTDFCRPCRFRLALLGGPRLTCRSSVRGVYVLRWVRIVLKCFCLYSIDISLKMGRGLVGRKKTTTDRFHMGRTGSTDFVGKVEKLR